MVGFLSPHFHNAKHHTRPYHRVKKLFEMGLKTNSNPNSNSSSLLGNTNLGV